MNETTRKAFNWTGLLWIVALLFGVYAIEQDVEGLLHGLGLQSGAGRTGLLADPAPAFAPGYLKVEAVTAGSPMAQAGVAAGDFVRFDHVADYARHCRAGEAVGFTVDHAGQKRHVSVVTIQAPPVANPWLSIETFNNITGLTAAIGGMLIVLYSRRQLPGILIGWGFIGYGLVTVVPQFWLASAGLFTPLLVLGTVNYAIIPVLFFAFSLVFYSQTVAPVRGVHRAAFIIFAAVNLLLAAALLRSQILLETVPLIGDGVVLQTVFSFAGYLACFAWLFLGWRRSEAATQQRYALMLVAISCVILAQAQASALFALNGGPDLTTNPWILVGDILGGIAGPALFAYAVLRHKVLDLGFAINRTLVYSILSFVILLAFGLAEWGIEKLLPKEYAEANAFAGAGIALVIFLVFHRVRDFVEHHVEKLFFRQWHQKEAALKRFVKEAGFILKRDHLAAAFVPALRTFADGAEAALYLIGEDGVYRRAEGALDGVPDIIDADDPFMVTLRTDRAAFEPHAAAIALILPMIHRTEVVGVALMGRKPSGFGYRPDEKEVLAFAAHQVGLDLHALKVEALEKRVADQDIELRTLRSVRTRKALSSPA